MNCNDAQTDDVGRRESSVFALLQDFAKNKIQIHVKKKKKKDEHSTLSFLG